MGRLGWVETRGREEGVGGSFSWWRMHRRAGEGEWKSMRMLRRGMSEVEHGMEVGWYRRDRLLVGMRVHIDHGDKGLDGETKTRSSMGSHREHHWVEVWRGSAQ